MYYIVVSKDEMSSRRTDLIRSESKSSSISEEKMDRVKSEHALYSLLSEPSDKRSTKSIGLLGPALDSVGPPDSEAVERPSLRRQLTHHVITRWYRAPEVTVLPIYFI
jgi:hypothetical protein